MKHDLTKVLACTLAICFSLTASAARWNAKTTDWSRNPKPVVGDWGMDRPGYPKGLYIHGITVKEGEAVRNAVIYDNDVFDDVFEDEWMYAMASLGRLRLVGQIVTPVLTDGWGFYHDDWVQTGLDAMERAQQSGIDMTKLPPITVGTIAPSEKEGERKPSDAARLYVELINKEYKENPQLPVIINIGGQAASLASAWCIDPSIADKCIVYYTDLKVYNGHYEWASKLVAKHFRIVNWGADEHWWHNKQHQNQWNVLPRPEHAEAEQNDENRGEWRLLTEKHLPMLDHMVHQFRNRGEYSRSDGDKGDAYGDGTFLHAWLPGIFGDAEIQEMRDGEAIQVTRFTQEHEALVKKFTLGILLDDRAYKFGKRGAQIQPSENGRFLQTVDGRPFFYLSDTAWELFHRLNREEADHYLQTRARQGFNAIQAVAVAELDGLNVENANGDLPFVDFDPTRPNEPYWQHVDYIVRHANELGICVGLLPTWGRYWHDGDRPLFTEDNARRYARWLANRYREASVIWILGGDRMPENDGHRSVIRAMADGLRQGDGGGHMITYHPGGWCGSAQEFHNDSWLAFNMRQNGHEVDFNSYPKNAEDYRRTPAKPLIDGEAVYEDHPVAFRPDERGHTVAADCRRALYWDLFTGTCGHTYGHHSVWQMYDSLRGPINRPLMSWREAILQPGARQMVHGKNLMLSRPYFTRIPATDEVLMATEPRSAWPGAGRYHFCATADSEGRYLMVYAPVGRQFTVRTNVVRAARIRLWWYNPRTGKATHLGVRQNPGQLTLCPPDAGEMLDWILVIDDASARFPKPGVPMKEYR